MSAFTTRCYNCGESMEVIDSTDGSLRDPKTGVWVSRWFDPDWVIEHHIQTECQHPSSKANKKNSIV